MYVPAQAGRIRQGDILRNLEYRDAYNTSVGTVTHNFSIVLTQDCDLLQDHKSRAAMQKTEAEEYELLKGDTPPNNDKFITSVLVCPAFVAENLKDGIHLAMINWKMQRINSSLKGPVYRNDNPRYHYLELDEGFGLPALIVDFKHTFSLPIEYLNKKSENKIARLEEMYAQSLCHRHSYYVSRVPLPDEIDD